jgi:hypothetical protein|tara:strand:+ start:63 stop:218 length:156 start_codon:yes stop_codon:yes gene_type:complete
MKNYILGYLISGIILGGSVLLAYSDNSAWPWFLAVGCFLFSTTIGAEIKKT